MEEKKELQIVHYHPVVSTVGLVICIAVTVIFVIVLSGLYLLVALFPLGFALAGLDGIFRKRVITFHPAGKTTNIWERSIWRKSPKLQVIKWNEISNVLVKDWGGGRGGHYYEIRLLLADDSVVPLKTIGRKKRAFAFRDEVASLLGIGSRADDTER